MTNTFYDEKGLEQLQKKCRLYDLLGWSSLALALLSDALFIIFSSYETRTLFIVMGSLIGSLFLFMFLYFIIKNKYQKDLAFQYHEILTGPTEPVEGEVLAISSEPLNLSDSTYVYEMTLKVNEERRVYYLPFFAKALPTVGEKAVFEVVSDRVRGYQDAQ